MSSIIFKDMILLIVEKQIRFFIFKVFKRLKNQFNKNTINSFMNLFSISKIFLHEIISIPLINNVFLKS